MAHSYCGLLLGAFEITTTFRVGAGIGVAAGGPEAFAAVLGATLGLGIGVCLCTICAVGWVTGAVATFASTLAFASVVAGVSVFEIAPFVHIVARLSFVIVKTMRSRSFGSSGSAGNVIVLPLIASWTDCAFQRL